MSTRSTTIEHNGIAYAAKMGKIINVTLGPHRHFPGIRASLLLNWDIISCHTPEITLDQWSEEKKRRVGSASGLDYIMRLLWVTGAETWESLKDSPVMVLHGPGKPADGLGVMLDGLAHPREDRVLIFDEFITEWKDDAL